VAQPLFHPSIEGAQHGEKTLARFLEFARSSGAAGAQPSNYMLDFHSRRCETAEILLRDGSANSHCHIGGCLGTGAGGVS
jgi:hypothetical protein